MKNFLIAFGLIFGPWAVFAYFYQEMSPMLESWFQ